MNFGGVVRGIGFIIEFIMKLSSLDPKYLSFYLVTHLG